MDDPYQLKKNRRDSLAVTAIFIALVSCAIMGYIYFFVLKNPFSRLEILSTNPETVESGSDQLPNQEDYSYHNGLGLSYMNREDYANAKIHLLKSIELNDNYRSSHNNLCIVYEKLEQRDLAEQECLRAIEIDPSNPNAYNNIAIFYENTGRVDLSIDYLEQSVRLEPAAFAYYNIGRLYLDEKEDYKKAEAAFKVYLELRPSNDPDAYGHLGLIYTKYYKDYNIAIKYLLESAKYVDDYWGTYFNLARNYEWIGDYQKALEYMDKANALKLGDSSIEYYLDLYKQKLNQ